MTPKFSAYPFDRVPRVTRDQAARESIVARWIAARGAGCRLATLLAARVLRATIVEPSASFAPHAAVAIVRVGGASFEVRGRSLAVQRIARRLLGGAEELGAPRPLSLVEESLWSLVVATALEDIGVPGQVWPRSGASHARAGATVELAVTLDDLVLGVQVLAPDDLALRAPPPRPLPRWADTVLVDVPIVLGRCAIERAALGRLALRNLVTLDRPVGQAAAELEILGGVVGARAASGAVVAEVATGYVPRDMTLPDDAHVELTVALGTTQLSLRQVLELAVGQVVPLGRPLAGPFEVRAAGQVVGRGELVNVDGELAVRIVSLDQ